MFTPEAELDFHDFGELLSYDIEQILTEFLEDSYNSGLSSVLIITGKGTVVRPLVNKLLSQSSLVKSFKHAGYFNGQTGAFEVVLV